MSNKEDQFPILNRVTEVDDLVKALAGSNQQKEAFVNEVYNLIALHNTTETELAKLIHDNATLFNEHDSLLVDHEAIKTERNSANEKVTQLQAQLQPFIDDSTNLVNQLNAEITKLKFEKETNLNAFTPTSRLSPAHPDPDTYHGDAKTLSIFLREVQAKLTVNADWYPTEATKMIYLKSRLRGRAYNTVIQGFAIDGSISYNTTKDIVALLQQSFGNIDEEGTAQQDIMKIRQNQKATPEFLNEWSQIAAKTGFDDKAKIAHLKHALHPEILIRLQQLQLSMVPIKTDLPGFLEQIRRIDSIIRSTNPDYVKTKSVLPSSILKNLTPDIPIELTTTQGGDAMDLSAIWTNASGNKIPQNDEEKLARREFCFKHGLCNWCNAKGHKATFCAKAPWNSDKAVSKDGVTIEKGKA